MAATVTIDKVYFETLLRRAELHTAGRDLTGIPIVSIAKVDHDNLLRLAHEYTCLRESLLNGGIDPEALEILIRGGNIISGTANHLVDGEENGQQTSSINAFERPLKGGVALDKPSESIWGERGSVWPSRRTGNGSQAPGNGRFPRRNSSYDQENDSWDPEPDKDNESMNILRTEKKRYAREEQRTIIARNLSERATHSDIVNFIRGGLLLDVYIRVNERSASISFVEGSAAQSFMSYVKRNDIYVYGKRVEFAWNDRQFILPGHVANKIGIGATRNLLIRNVHPNITEDRLREDLDHIHNLVIIDITFRHGDAYIQLNSIHNSLFARTCMMSRAAYKGLKIEWYPDDCAEPLPKIQPAPKKENSAPSTKPSNNMKNRFQMLNLDDGETDDESEEEIQPSPLNNITKRHITQSTSWNSRVVAA